MLCEICEKEITTHAVMCIDCNVKVSNILIEDGCSLEKAIKKVLIDLQSDFNSEAVEVIDEPKPWFIQLSPVAVGTDIVMFALDDKGQIWKTNLFMSSGAMTELKRVE